MDMAKGKKDAPVVLVTGSLRRIGAAIALYFAKNGWRVVLHGRTSEDSPDVDEMLSKLEACSSSMNSGGHCYMQCDLMNIDERQKLPAMIVCRMGRLDCLVNNAAVYGRSSMLDVTSEEILQSYEINCLAPFDLMRGMARVVMESGGRGSIINILDQKICHVEPAAGAYILAKKSLYDITLACAREWAPQVRVNGVAPGIVLAPPGVENGGGLARMADIIPMKEVTSPEWVAECCGFLAKASCCTGQIIYADGGLHLTDVELGEPHVRKLYDGSQK